MLSKEDRSLAQRLQAQRLIALSHWIEDGLIYQDQQYYVTMQLLMSKIQ